MTEILIVVAALLSVAGGVAGLMWIWADAPPRSIKRWPWIVAMPFLSPFITVVAYSVVRRTQPSGSACAAGKPFAVASALLLSAALATVFVIGLIIGMGFSYMWAIPIALAIACSINSRSINYKKNQ